MIDYDKRHIILPATITKNGNERTVPINDSLWNYLEPILNKKYPKDYFVFGSGRPSGEGNRGKHRDFIPGPTQLKRDTATKRWEKLIKIDLSIQVNLYSMKKAGANAKIKAGMSTRTLKELYGHSSELTTEIYITDLQSIMHQEIKRIAPSF